RDRDHSTRCKTQTVGIAKTRGQHKGRLAVGRDPEKPLLARDRVEPALAVALEARDEIVAGGRRLVGIAHALIKISLSIAVEVVQPRDLVATQDVDQTIGDDKAERLVQP